MSLTFYYAPMSTATLTEAVLAGAGKFIGGLIYFLGTKVSVPSDFGLLGVKRVPSRSRCPARCR